MNVIGRPLMFTAYIDDSGSDPSQKVGNATALIIPTARIAALEREWDCLRLKEGFSSFHASEFVARNPRSEFAEWSDEKRDRVFRRVRAICKKYGTQPLSFTVNKKDYDEIVPESFRRHSGVFHYTWAIRHVLKHIVQWRIHNHVPSPLAYVFDWMGDKKRNARRREIEDVMEQAEEDAVGTGIPGEYVNWGFCHREDLPGLQCVDALAWSVYQYGLYAFYRVPLIREAQIAWDDFGKYLGGKWGFDVTVTRDNLRTWVDKESADGISMRRFQEWELRKRGKQSGKVAK